MFWRERIEVDGLYQTYKSTISIEGDGLEGVALFSVDGKITKSFDGEFEFSYNEAIQTTNEVLDGYQAASYTTMFLSGTSKSKIDLSWSRSRCHFERAELLDVKPSSATSKL